MFSMKTQNVNSLQNFVSARYLQLDIGATPAPTTYISIVGAGVVGSALFYTIEKVTFSHSIT